MGTSCITSASFDPSSSGRQYNRDPWMVGKKPVLLGRVGGLIVKGGGRVEGAEGVERIVAPGSRT